MTKRFARSTRRAVRDAGYDYYEAVTEDGVDALFDCDVPEDMDENELAVWVTDTLWDDDNVTGNGSGSYTMDRAKSKEYVNDNLDLLREAVSEFDVKDTLADKFMDDDWEWMDVIIRCYVLQSVNDTIVKEYLARKRKGSKFDIHR